MSERLTVNDIPVEIRRNKRRRTRFGLGFDPAGFVILDAPMNASESEVRTVIEDHHRWLQVRLDKVREETSQSGLLNYESGELLHYLGQPYELVVSLGLFEEVSLIGNRIVVTATDDACLRVNEIMTHWYQCQAQTLFAQVLASWIYLPWLTNGLPKWRHRYMRSQWGSCSSEGRISLNTHLVKTPRKLVEYVILHELCHLQHHNHGRRFYDLMDRYMPTWQKRNNELNKHLPILMQE